MTDRDTFAAAALTGLLTTPTDKDRSMEYWARLSYESADAMLRERERRNHDAVPAARARTDSAAGEPGGGHGSDRTDNPAPRTAMGTGDICERLRGWFKDVNAVPAIDLMDEAAAEIERLRLTDFEKEAIEQGASCISRLLPHWGHPMSLRAAALRALLERTK